MGPMVKSADLVVVGAGIHGLVVAKTYMELHPGSKVVVIETAATVGGVWAEHRLYPGLVSNNMLGTFEFSDFPMDSETFGIKPFQHIAGPVMHSYLTAYAKKFGVFTRIRFQTKVVSAELQSEDSAWLLTLSGTENTPNADVLLARKLVVATGMTSEAFLPEFVGSSSFNAPIVHTKELLQCKDVLASAASVVVLGGTKSAWDACYQYAATGAQVHMVIRESGHGTVWMAHPFVTPFKKWLEKLTQTRLLTWFSPCIWGEADGYGGIRRFLHGTALGRFIVDKFWGLLQKDLVAQNGFDSHPETKKLTPWIDAFWVATGLSLLNYPTDFLELVRNGKIKVHVADITGLSPKTVHLSDGKSLPADALICATGWRHIPPMKFLPEGIDSSLGLPVSSSGTENGLTLAADREILSQFPRLKDQPKLNPKYKPLRADEVDQTGFNLYRFMVPPAHIADHTIAFAGMMISITTTVSAQTQALWISAYFDGALPICSSSESQKTVDDALFVSSSSESQKSSSGLQSICIPSQETSQSICQFSKASQTELKGALPVCSPSKADILRETVLHNRFGRWRYPGAFAGRVPDFVFDSLPYVDLLLRDLGLRTHRKNGMFAEVVQAYGPEDYQGLVDEWRVKQDKRKDAKKVD